MSHVISVSKPYHHQDGSEYEVMKVDRDSVTFETSDGSIVYMEIDELVSDLEEGVLLPIVDENSENDDEDEDRED